MNRGQQNKSVRWITGAMLATGVALAGAGSAVASSPSNPIVIGACGYTISSSGFYQVQKSLTAKSGDCIDIKASNVVLDILKNGSSLCQGTTIKGNGSSGIGIHIFSNASHVFIEGQNSNIAGFATGIEDDGSYNDADDFNTTNNVNIGLLLNGTKYSTYSNFFTGILQDSNGADCFPVGIQGPQYYGVELLKASNSQIINGTAAGNGYYGEWTNDSTSNRVVLFNASPGTGGTEFAGFWAGSNGNADVGSTNKSPGADNLIYDDTTEVTLNNGAVISGQAQYGFVFQQGEKGYVAADLQAENNFIDIYAINDSTCAANTYFFNFTGPGGAVPSCVTDR